MSDDLLTTAAIAAAADSIHDRLTKASARDTGWDYWTVETARVALEAAMPLIREAIAEEVMTTRLPREVADGVNLKRWFVEGARWSARIVRGEQ